MGSIIARGNKVVPASPQLWQYSDMLTPAEAIAAELRRVFPAVRDKPFLPLVNSTQGLEPFEIAEEFKDKDDWIKLEADWLDHVPNGLGSALSFLSDKAICFYIPAFLRADLEGRLGHVDPTFHLCHGFDDLSRGHRIRPRDEATWTDYGQARWAGLAKDQATAIVHYLEWRIERDGPDIAYSCVQALRAYWYERAAGVGTDGRA